MKKRLRLLLFLLSLLALASVAVFTAWAYTPLGPMPQALEALQSSASVAVQVRPWIVFQPLAAQPQSGVIFYPGGRVDPRAYAPAMRSLAERGYLAVIVPMPFNLAVFAPNRAAQVMAAYPEIKTWAVGGHSLGGAMAASFVYANPGQAQGLFLWASYPAQQNDLHKAQLAAISIYGSLDGLASPEKIEASKPLLPPSTVFLPIQGGNHAQFGWYGEQPGDGAATISRQAQQEQVLQGTLAFLLQLAGEAP